MCKSADGKQLSDGWILGSGGLEKAVRDVEAAQIRKAYDNDEVVRLVSKTDDTNGTRFFGVTDVDKQNVKLSSTPFEF